jgi:hypothetical protein
VIPDPTVSTESKKAASMVICCHLIAAIRGTVEFRSADHRAIMAAGKVKTQAQCLSESQEKLEVILDDLPDEQSRTIKRGEQMGAWLSVLPSMTTTFEVPGN